MRKSAVIAIGTACAALVLAGCDGGRVIKSGKAPVTSESLSLESLEPLSGKRIFFGHQSVGWNIIDGLKDIATEKGWVGFNIVETRKPGDAPGFYHAAIGQNGDPLGKIRDFESIMRDGMGDKVDIALMKFCYVDFSPETDVDVVFAAYRDAMKRLAAVYPRINLLYATVPLETSEEGWKAIIKRLIGRTTRNDSNIARERMNEKIRAECAAGGKALFDLAQVEATSSDGSIIELTFSGGRYYSLRNEYTVDGSHLNSSGRKAAAMELISLLAGAKIQ
jgi:hypothetical protein